MICPVCKSEFVDGISTCSDCNVELVIALPEQLVAHEQGDKPLAGALVRVPVKHEGDVALIQSLLESGGFSYRLDPGFGEAPGDIYVLREDLPEIKEYLGQYKSRSTLSETPIPIQW